MDPLIARPLMTIIMILLVMVFISLPFLSPDTPEFWIDIVSLIVLLFILAIMIYSIRRGIMKRGKS